MIPDESLLAAREGLRAKFADIERNERKGLKRAERMLLVMKVAVGVSVAFAVFDFVTANTIIGIAELLFVPVFAWQVVYWRHSREQWKGFIADTEQTKREARANLKRWGLEL